MLISFLRYVDGVVRGTPLGDDPTGMISYQPDGYMSALLSARDRAWSGRLSYLEADTASQAAAATRFLAYGARYSLDGDVVTHSLFVASWPEMVGVELVRSISWELGDLLLTTSPIITSSGKCLTDQLRWRRVEA